MGTDSSQPEPSRTNLYTDLFDTLATFRNAENARHMAEELIRKARTDVQLVWHLTDCIRAVFYDSDGRTLKGYDFDNPGITEAVVDMLWWLANYADSWVSSHQDELDWVHPHFRWVLDLEDTKDE